MPALLVVDVQRGFINEHTDHVPALVQGLLPRYDVTIATRFVSPEAAGHRGRIGWHRRSPGRPLGSGRFTPRSEAAELAFSPRDDTWVMEKSSYTCVTSDFLDYLDGRGVTGIHIVGIDTDICVLKCAVDLFEAGYEPFVLARYCASHGGAALHEAALMILPRYLGPERVILDGP